MTEHTITTVCTELFVMALGVLVGAPFVLILIAPFV